MRPLSFNTKSFFLLSENKDKISLLKLKFIDWKSFLKPGCGSKPWTLSSWGHSVLLSSSPSIRDILSSSRGHSVLLSLCVALFFCWRLIICFCSLSLISRTLCLRRTNLYKLTHYWILPGLFQCRWGSGASGDPDPAERRSWLSHSLKTQTVL